MVRIGQSYDIHKIKLKENSIITLGGIKIPSEYEIVAYSDGDILLHVIIEALIGAMGLGDIGTFFPDTDDKYKNIDSQILLLEIKKELINNQYKINNIDALVNLETPILKDYKLIIKKNIAKLLELEENRVNIKATRGEGLGFVGEMKGICAFCSVIIEND